jgi:hypothetical protein
MIQKNNGFGFCPEFLRNLFHRHPPWFESEDHDRFSVLPACHALLHPIALRQTGISLGRKPTLTYHQRKALNAGKETRGEIARPLQYEPLDESSLIAT